jgi:hypothetical protein
LFFSILTIIGSILGFFLSCVLFAGIFCYFWKRKLSKFSSRPNFQAPNVEAPNVEAPNAEAPNRIAESNLGIQNKKPITETFSCPNHFKPLNTSIHASAESFLLEVT